MSDKLRMIPNFTVEARCSILAEKLDYNHFLMNVPAMWQKTKGEGVKLVVLDTGRPNHVDLNPAGSKSFVPNGSQYDKCGHSTHCGGGIAAIANNGMGIAGISPEVEDYYGAVLDDNGEGELDWPVKGIYWAVDEIGAQIISMSLGIPAGFPRIKDLEKACDYARSQGCTVIAASGNEASGVGQPACFDSVIAVAAVNNAKQLAWFANHGPEVDFACGGVDVYSTFLNNGYAVLSGTSMACPALSAVAALIQADEKKDNGKFLTPDQLVTKLRKISVDVGPNGVDQFAGYGIPFFNAPDTVTAKEIVSGNLRTQELIQAFVEGATRADKAGMRTDEALIEGIRCLGLSIAR